MALRMAMRRATTTTSTLFTEFMTHHRNIPNHRSAAVASLSSRRPFSSAMYDENCTITTHGGSFTRSDEFPIRRGTSDQYMENPFQVSGPRGAYEAKKVEEGLFVRMEMPGIEKEDVSIRVEYGTLFIEGEGKRESEHEDSGRTYTASIELPSSLFQLKRINAKLKNGVLRMLIPMAKSSEATSGSGEIKCL